MSVLVGRAAPDFTAPAVMANNLIEEQYSFLEATKGKYRVLFFWPMDFTFVCPSEIIAHDNRLEKFKELGVEVVGVSVDNPYTHYAWKETNREDGGIGQVKFPIVADVKHSITQAYGIEHPEEGVAFRASFLIDKEGMVRHQIVNDLPLGRNVDEMIRLIEALQHVEKYGEVCPAGWKKGEKAMVADAQGVAKYLAGAADKL